MEHGQLFVLILVMLVFAAGIIRRYLRLQEVQPRENPHDQARIEALEQRVRTLERIVTDKGYDLKGEFDKL